MEDLDDKGERKVILVSLFLFFTLTLCTTLGGFFILLYFVPLEKEWKIGGGGVYERIKKLFIFMYAWVEHEGISFLE
jgi:hypothetical protein